MMSMLQIIIELFCINIAQTDPFDLFQPTLQVTLNVTTDARARLVVPKIKLMVIV